MSRGVKGSESGGAGQVGGGGAAGGLLGLLVAAALAAALWPGLPAKGPWRPPIPAGADKDEPGLSTEEREDRERSAGAARRRWFEELHRAPAGVSWKGVERGNAEAALARRRAAPPPAAGPRWVERGSENLAGRMHEARLSSDKQAIYAGSAHGGLWTASPDGDGWTPLADDVYGGAQQLLALPAPAATDPDILVMASGSAIYRSADEGGTWSRAAGLPSDLWQIKRLTAPAGQDALVFAMVTNYWTYDLYRSLDGGQTFSLLRALDEFQGDLWIPRDGDRRLYLLDDGELLQSDDDGDTFSRVGLVDAGMSSGSLCGSEAGAPRLWVLGDGDGGSLVRRSDDAGETWVELGPYEDFWAPLAASRQDPDLFAYGGMELHVTMDGGASFHKQNDWWSYYDSPGDQLHADMMGLTVDEAEDGSELWWIGTDGGLYRSRDRLDTVENLSLSGLRVSQYYSTLTSSVDPTHVAAGAQDQGYQLSTGMVPEGDLLRFYQATSGDYGHLSSADGSHAYVYSTYPGYILVQFDEDDPQLGWGDFPSGESQMAWIPPVVADPVDPAAFFFLASQIYRYTEARGSEWKGELYSEQDFSSEGYEYASALAFSPFNPDIAWAATSYGRVFRSTDHAVTWTMVADESTTDHYLYGSTILPSRQEEQLVYLAGSGYGNPSVWRSTDDGLTWEAWDDGLPRTFVYGLALAPDGSGRLFAATETGAWMREPGASEWTDIGAGAPVTTYWSVEALTAENSIRFGTYGRGIWDYQLDPDHEGCYPVQDFDGDAVLCDVDCDDHDPARGAPEAEVCGDEIDQDCDGVDAACPEGDGGGDEGGDDGLGDGGGGGGGGGAGKGCACSGAPTTGAAPWLLVGLGALLARRRRSARGA